MTRWIVSLIALGCALALLLAAGDASGDAHATDCKAKQKDRVVKACVSCHKGRQSLSGQDPSELAGLIRAIRDGDAAHPAPLPELDDAAIDALSEALTCS